MVFIKIVLSASYLKIMITITEALFLKGQTTHNLKKTYLNISDQILHFSLFFPLDKSQFFDCEILSKASHLSRLSFILILFSKGPCSPQKFFLHVAPSALRG